jgi:hypothetical protein
MKLLIFIASLLFGNKLGHAARAEFLHFERDLQMASASP